MTNIIYCCLIKIVNNRYLSIIDMYELFIKLITIKFETYR